MLDEEQVKQIKKQLLEQIDKFPGEQRETARGQIEAMNAEQLEAFLVKNKLIKTAGIKEKAEECIFCSIINNKTSSFKIDENKKALAILEINPLSKGHSIVISKEHKKLPSSAFSLANKIAKKLKSKLKAQEIKIENAVVMGHHLINVIPLYKDEKLEKKKAEEKELILLQDKLKAKKQETKSKPEVKKISEIKLEKAPRRIP